MINKKDLELKVGKMDHATKVTSSKEKNMDKVIFSLQILILGRYQWSDGAVYNGDWKENKIAGFGIYEWLDGRKYEGEWLNNCMHGKGIYSWPDGRRYEGEYVQDKKEGEGEYVWVKYLSSLMEENIKVSGKMVNKMAMEFM